MRLKHGTSVNTGQPQTVPCASRGEFVFDDAVDRETREAIREMWINRIAGFRERDLARYLRDNVATTRYIKDGRVYSFKTFRRVCRVLFPMQRLASLVRIPLCAEVLDARVTRAGDVYVARGVLVVMLGARVVRQSRLAMSCRKVADRWVWDRAVDDRCVRAAWPYRGEKTAAGEIRFVRSAIGENTSQQEGCANDET